MAQVQFTEHLTTLFPQLPRALPSLEASTLAELVAALERMAPGIAFYLCDERGRLRRHVNVFVDEEMLVDRNGLSDPLSPACPRSTACASARVGGRVGHYGRIRAACRTCTHRRSFGAQSFVGTMLE